MAYYGYRYRSDGKHYPGIHLEDQEAVRAFIKQYHEDPQIVITDNQDRQLLLMRDGVDLFNDLDRIGISLADLLNQIRQDQVQAESPSGGQHEKPHWEVLYDQIGLSPGEIHMRQRVKAACRAARTVRDVAELVRGTYFDAHFRTADGQKWYRYFDADTYEASVMIKDSAGEWIDVDEPEVLSPTAQVRHLRSSEDIHTFEIIGP